MDLVEVLRIIPRSSLPIGVAWNKCEEAADEIERLREALRSLIAACDAGKLIELGVGGMTLEAQLRRSIINGVSAFAVEEARAALGEKKPLEDRWDNE
jgi:hypothetical protein